MAKAALMRNLEVQGLVSGKKFKTRNGPKFPNHHGNHCLFYA